MKMEEEGLSEKFLSIYMNNTVLLAFRTPQFKHVNSVEVAKMYTVPSTILGLIFLNLRHIRKTHTSFYSK